MSVKIIRDPVHDVIAFDMDQAGDALLFNLLATQPMQRLRRIRQLGLASLAYPGADHSRYGHALGVMQTARRMMEHLSHHTALSQEDRLACACAALLHDLGHGPFSHLFERISQLSHEEQTQRLILDPDGQVYQTLSAYDAGLPQKVAGLLHGGTKPTLWSDILCSQLDADRFDYLLRDNLMTGSRYGGFDLTWLLHALSVDPQQVRLVVARKGVSAVETYLQARYHMYHNVYFHKVVRSAEGMVRLTLQRARLLATQQRLQADEPVLQALLGRRLPTDVFLELDDVSLLYCFKRWRNSEDAILSHLCRGLLDRNIYKTVDLSALSPQEAQTQVKIALELVACGGGDADYDLFFDQPTDTPYETFVPQNISQGPEILVRDEAGNHFPFAHFSPLSAALNRQLTFQRLHVAPQWIDLVRKALPAH